MEAFTLLTIEVTTKQNAEIIRGKSGLFMLYDHVLRNDGKIIINRGTWGNKDQAGNKRITLDDMQMFCIHHDANCRIQDLGKKVITLIIPNEQPVFLCGYHYFVHALIDRFTDEGYLAEDNWHP